MRYVKSGGGKPPQTSITFVSSGDVEKKTGLARDSSKFDIVVQSLYKNV